MLWGLTQIFDLYKSGKDFAVIFDNKCDIEIVSNCSLSLSDSKVTRQELISFNDLASDEKEKVKAHSLQLTKNLVMIISGVQNFV